MHVFLIQQRCRKDISLVSEFLEKQQEKNPYAVLEMHV